MWGATPAAASCARAGSQTRETKSSFVIATGGAPFVPGGTETRATFAGSAAPTRRIRRGAPYGCPKRRVVSEKLA